MHMWNNYTTVKTYIPQFEQKFQSWGKYTTIRTLHHSWDIYSSVGTNISVLGQIYNN